MSESIVFLYVLLSGYGTHLNVHRFQYPTMEACLEALKSSSTDISDGADSETHVTKLCGYDDWQVGVSANGKTTFYGKGGKQGE